MKVTDFEAGPIAMFIQNGHQTMKKGFGKGIQWGSAGKIQILTNKIWTLPADPPMDTYTSATAKDFSVGDG